MMVWYISIYPYSVTFFRFCLPVWHWALLPPLPLDGLVLAQDLLPKDLALLLLLEAHVLLMDQLLYMNKHTQDQLLPNIAPSPELLDIVKFK